LEGRHRTPRARLYATLVEVGHVIRHNVASRDTVAKDAPRLLAQLDEATRLAATARSRFTYGSTMEYSATMVIESMRAVIYHAAGNVNRALTAADAAVAALDRPASGYTSFLAAASLVPLAGIYAAAHSGAGLAAILSFLADQARTWPIAANLLAKARRRVQYATGGGGGGGGGCSSPRGIRASTGLTAGPGALLSVSGDGHSGADTPRSLSSTSWLRDARLGSAGLMSGVGARQRRDSDSWSIGSSTSTSGFFSFAGGRPAPAAPGEL
jgi:hypothetical protein